MKIRYSIFTFINLCLWASRISIKLSLSKSNSSSSNLSISATSLFFFRKSRIYSKWRYSMMTSSSRHQLTVFRNFLIFLRIDFFSFSYFKFSSWKISNSRSSSQVAAFGGAGDNVIVTSLIEAAAANDVISHHSLRLILTFFIDNIIVSNKITTRSWWRHWSRMNARNSWKKTVSKS